MLLAIALVGSIVHFSLSKSVAALQWIKTSEHPHKPTLPNINTANAIQLEKLPGVGPRTAQNIIAYRKAHGVLLRLEDLRNVKGITKTNYKKIEEAYAYQP